MSTTTTTLTRKQQLQAECTAKGITFTQRDTIETLLGKLATTKEEPVQPVNRYRGEY
jgi:hypothetical protein